MTAPLTAAVIGLGQAGSRFDEEPRPAIWSHAGAYLGLGGHYRLVGGADPDSGNRARFQARCPSALVLGDGAELLRSLRPDVVSLCTPPQGRADLVERLLAVHRPKVLICEKPLETESDQRRRLVAACAEAQVPLMVNYNRRFSSLWRSVRQAIASGRLGRVTSVTVLAPNRLWSIGSHAVNLMLYLAGEEVAEWRALPLPSLDEKGEPAADLLCRFASGAAGRVITAGWAEMLVLEADVIGEAGRLRVTGNGDLAVFRPFVTSPHYVGYRIEGEPETLATGGATESAFVIMAQEAAQVARGEIRPGSTGAQAMAGENLLDAIHFQCKTECA